MSDKYAAITAHAARFDIRLMCAALDVSPSGYYAAVARLTATPTARDQTRARRRIVVRADVPALPQAVWGATPCPRIA